MDLQAILDASDSSDEDGSSTLPSMYQPYKSAESLPSHLHQHSTLDVEQILRDDDDEDEDEYDDDDDYTDDNTLSTISAAARAPVVSPSSMPQQQISSHTTEDWAVLQAILREGDDDDDDDDDDSDTNHSDEQEDALTAMRAALGTTKNSRDRVDILLTQSTEEEEQQLFEQEEQVWRAKHTSGSATMNTSTFTSSSNNNISPLRSPVVNSGPPLWTLQKYQGGGVSPSMSRDEREEPLPQQQPEDLAASPEDISQRCLHQAMAYERKLLKAGHREIVSPLMVKRRLKPKVELVPRKANQKNNPNGKSGNNNNNNQTMMKKSTSTTGAAYFNFSGVVENRVQNEISASLFKHSQKETAKVHTGLPTCLAFTSRFIAVGTQLGIILLYDLFGSLRQRLGASAEDDNLGARKAGSITSLDLNHAGDCCCAGYKSGLVVLWDTIRGTILRKVDDQHPSPITAVRFLMDLKIITVDAAGLVNKLNFTKNILWATYSMEVDCLLDGTAGQILAMNTLEPFALVNPHVRPQNTALVRVLRKLSLVALSSERSSFAVAVEPSVSVLHRWARPTPEKMDPVEPLKGTVKQQQQQYLPCLSWGWALVSGGGNVVMPILARAWGCSLQLLRASFPTLEETSSFRPGEEPAMHWPAFGVHKEVDAGAPIVALEWLSERSLVYLTVTNEFTLVDTVMMTLTERIDFSGLKLVFAEFALSRSADTTAICTTFQNSIRCSDKRLMVLCQQELRCISILGARQRISSLESDGEWLEALALALDHYESTVASQEDRKRDPHRRKDLSKHPEFRANRGDEEEWVAKLLMRYLNLAVDNAPEESNMDAVEVTHSSSPSKNRITLAQSHFQMLAGVCTEFCVVTRRLDLLYGPIFRRFQESGYTSVFLDVLEPYVLNDKLSYIAAEVMAYFVEHCKATNGVATVERCLLHMDCTIMDFDSILSLLRQNAMYSALCYVFNQGLDDYVTPLEILLEKVFDEADTGSAMLLRRRGHKSQNDFTRYGYKALLYLQTCVRGKSFPKEENISPEERQATVKPELLNFLMQDEYKPSSHAKQKSGTLTVVGQRAQPFPYARMLLQVDAVLTLDIVSEILDSADNSSVVESEGWQQGSRTPVARPPSKQSVVNMVLSLVLPELAGIKKEQVALMNSKSATASFLEFAAKYIIRGVVRLDKDVTLMIMDRMASKFSSSTDPSRKLQARQTIMELLSALPRDSYDPDKVLAVIEKAGIHRAALLLHQQVASSWRDSDLGELELRLHHFTSAIDCFIEDEDPGFRKEVFDYVRRECVGVLNTSLERQGIRQRSLRQKLYSKLPGLVRLDALMAAHIVAELLVDDLDSVVDALDTGDGGHVQYSFLRAIISGDLVALDPVAGSVMNLSVDHHLKYLSLMARLHPDMVYEYLSTHDSYRAEDALTLCQEHDIADASAYLLERMGNVSSALQLILQTLEGRMMGLKRTIRGMGVDVFRHQHHRSGNPTRKNESSEMISKQEREVDGVNRILVVALDLCERNSGSFTVRTEHGSQLWFNVLDRLINAKGFLRLANEQQEHAKVMGGVLSELLRMTMQRMVSSVPLTDLVRKVTSDHSGSRLGELREMVESLLSTYGFELQVFGNAAELFRQDLLQMQRSQTRLQLQGAAVRTVLNTNLEKPNGKKAPLTGHQQSNVILRIGAHAEAVVAENDNVPYSRQAENTFATALTRLQTRKSGRKAMSSAGLSHLTQTEQMYHAHETEPVVVERITGALGEAAHRGRLMTFG
eukprot:scaffold742_cov165-Amphora_coffeaeformis.AAC.3